MTRSLQEGRPDWAKPKPVTGDEPLPLSREIEPPTPFPVDALKRAASHCKQMLVVEMSMGQMVDDVRLAAECRVPVHFYGRTGGVIPTPKEILGEIDKLLK